MNCKLYNVRGLTLSSLSLGDQQEIGEEGHDTTETITLYMSHSDWNIGWEI